MIRYFLIALISFLCLPFIVKGNPIKIKTVKSYIENSSGKRTFNNDNTVIFEIDTIQKTLSVKSVISNRTYNMIETPTIINRNNSKTIKFEVKDASIIKKYVVNIPNPLIGNSISVKETMSTSSRDLLPIYYYTDKYSSDNTYTTRYISKHFHDVNETSPILDKKCSIGVSDTAILIGDLDDTSENKMLLVTSVEDISNPTNLEKQKKYHCQLKGEDYTFIVKFPNDEYSTPIFELTRLVYGKPVVTTIYSGDFIDN